MRDRVPECEEECQSVRQIVSGAECQSVRQRGSMGDTVSEREIEGNANLDSVWLPCSVWTLLLVLLVVIAATAVAHADGTISTS